MIESTGSQKNSFVLPSKRLLVMLMTTVCSLTILNILSLLSAYLPIENYWLNECRSSLIRLFDTNGEANIPSWYSSSALLTASALLYLIAYFKKRSGDLFKQHWTCLAVIFFCLSVDEIAMLHEMLSKPLRAIFNTKGLLFYPWVLAASVVLIMLFFAYLRFLKHLPSTIRLLFITSGILFVFGAIVIESFEAYLDYNQMTNRITFRLSTTIEECLEMIAVVLFIYALMQYLNEHVLPCKNVDLHVVTESMQQQLKK